MNSELPHVDLNSARATRRDGRGSTKTTHDVLPVQGDAMSIFEEVFAEQRAAIGRRRSWTGQEKEAEALRYLDRARRIVYCVAPSIPERVLTMTASQTDDDRGALDGCRQRGAGSAGASGGKRRRPGQEEEGRRRAANEPLDRIYHRQSCGGDRSHCPLGHL